MTEEKKEKKTESAGITRREFLKDAGLVVGGAAVTSGALWATGCGGGATTQTVEVTKTVEVAAPNVGPAMINITVNGMKYNNVLVEPQEVLRDTIRETIGLTSPKDMCHGTGACGSCTVIMNGRPILSCLTLSIECNGATIQTSEGIADDKHPIVQAYVDNWAMACGYCTPGSVVTAKALLDRIPKPTEQDIKEALAGNLCRCGVYANVIKAVTAAATKLK